MSHIELLSSDTINKIAAGEVIERPASVVKELIENSVDSGAGAVTVEAKDGGLSFIRVTDNGSGIPRGEVSLAFERHATSKIRSELDLIGVSSLGFRGEALSSIASVAKVEMITRRHEDLMGTRYVIEGGKQSAAEDVGAPEGTTIIVRDLFFNTPARRKFMKTSVTEGSYISAVVEKLALSRPDVSFRLLLNGRGCLHTSGNGRVKDIIYLIYGREAADGLFEVSGMPPAQASPPGLPAFELSGTEISDTEASDGKAAGGEAASLGISGDPSPLRISGYAAKPVFSRGNRSCEIFFVNGRYVKSPLLTKALENAYTGFLMQHRYPFAVLYIDIDPALIDVNVHPAKREIRFRQEDMVYHCLYDAVRRSLEGQELIPDVGIGLNGLNRKRPSASRPAEKPPEPFERARREAADGLSTIELLQRSFHEDKGALQSQMQPCAGIKEPAGITEPDKDALQSQTQPCADTKVQVGITELAKDGLQSQTQPCADIKETSGITEQVKDKEPDAVMHEKQDDYLPTGETFQREDISLLRDHGPAAYKKMQEDAGAVPYSQLSFGERLFTEETRKEYVLIGQLFGTYWLIQYRDKFMMVDQHAAHEKVLFEELMASFSRQSISSQQLLAPIILTLNDREIQAVERLMEQLSALGYDIRPFGGKEYAVYGIPYNLYSIAEEELLREMIDSLTEEEAAETGDLLYERIAAMSCKAAVKGNTVLSSQEADVLIDRLLKLEHPYTCPHGRPTMIVMSKNEIEKKFKRIVNLHA